MFSIAICDDAQEQVEATKALISAYVGERPGTDIETHTFNTGLDLLVAIKDGRQFDLLILDIIMPDMDGIMLAKKLREDNCDSPLVFCTHSSSFALDAFGVSAVQYILKPIEQNALFATLDKVIAARRIEQEKFIALPGSSSRTISIFYSNIIMIEYVNRCLRFHLVDGTYVDSRTIRVSFAKGLEEILADSRFLFMHQSFVINMARVVELRGRTFIMEGGLEATVPKPRYPEIKRAYFDYLSGT
jgi:DNA-binding LytR/AlgR family response regulator